MLPGPGDVPGIERGGARLPGDVPGLRGMVVPGLLSRGRTNPGEVPGVPGTVVNRLVPAGGNWKVRKDDRRPGPGPAVSPRATPASARLRWTLRPRRF